MAPRVQRTQSAKEKKLQSRRAKLAGDEQRTDGIAIKDTDLSKWIAAPVSWGYEILIHIAVRRFKDFLEIMGPKEPRSKLYLLLVLMFHQLILFLIKSR
jgi:hypothetical protein